MYKQEFSWILEKLNHHMQYFKQSYPSACTTEGIYRIKGNDDWTNGFYIGMYLIAYEYTKEAKYLDYGRTLTDNMIKRLEDNFVVDHHDIGFLVLPSITAMYEITGELKYLEYTIKACDILTKRYHEDAKFIQAWGKMGDPAEYRLIIDSLINLPLLYKGYELTKNPKYKTVYQNHFVNVVDNIIREDGSTYHTYYFDLQTKKPKKAVTAQGFSDDSCWSRGQAWLLLGSILNYNYTHDQKAIDIFLVCHEYIQKHTLDDPIPYWDYIFNHTSNQYHDSSAAVINLIAYQYYYDCDDPHLSIIFQELRDKYTTKDDKLNHGILSKSVYAYSAHKGIGESCLWGDYYYMEFLYKQITNKAWRGYFDVH